MGALQRNHLQFYFLIRKTQSVNVSEPFLFTIEWLPTMIFLFLRGTTTYLLTEKTKWFDKSGYNIFKEGSCYEAFVGPIRLLSVKVVFLKSTLVFFNSTNYDSCIYRENRAAKPKWSYKLLEQWNNRSRHWKGCFGGVLDRK